MIDYDVIQVGFGPVGQVHSTLLGRHGHKIGVFERWPSLYPLPRAGHIDHEVMRIFQAMGAAEAVERTVIPIPDYDWFSADGQVLLHLDWNNPTPSGWKSDYLMYQPYMEDALRTAVAAQPTVELNLGWEVVGLEQRTDDVAVTLRQGHLVDGAWTPTGPTRTVTTRYVIGADGAGSFVRRASNIEWIDYGFEEDWLVLDVRPHDPDLHIDMPEAGQICDPERPVSLFRRLGREHARWEFMLLPGETEEEMRAEATAWRLLARWGLDASNASVIRRAVYTFRSLIAETFRDDRVLLVGDAAHLMPPFMGQGMCSGIRDAANLAWKLDLVLRGASAPELLDSYTVERHPHVDQIIKTSMALGQIVCISDPQAAAERDELLPSGRAAPRPPFPWLTEGILALEPAPGNASPGPVGRLGVQGRVVADGRTGRADDLLGNTWQVLTDDLSIARAVAESHQETLQTIGAQVRHVSRAHVGGESLVDLDATYHDWFRSGGFRVVVVRPDFYVYGTANTAEEATALIARLRDQLALEAAATVD